MDSIILMENSYKNMASYVGLTCFEGHSKRGFSENFEQ